MTTDFDVQPASLTQAGDNLTAVARDLDTALEQLRSALSGLDAAWGNDTNGTRIQRAYSQVATQAMSAIESYTGQVADAGQALPAGAQGFQGWDSGAAQRLSTVYATPARTSPAAA